MFTQPLICFLVATAAVYVLPISSIKTVHQEGHERNCADFLCPIGAFDKTNRADYQAQKKLGENDINDDDIDEVCSGCEDCTHNGFSVCAQYRNGGIYTSKHRAKRLSVSHDNNCACSSSVPKGCQLVKPNEIKNPYMETVHICYLRTILTPPSPQASFLPDKKGGNKIVVATLEAFWLDAYWAQFKLYNLTLFYQFSLTTPEYCGGDLKTIEGIKGPEHICTASLPMEMDNASGDDKSIPDGSNGNYDDPSNATISDEEEYDDGVGPEVQFEKDVFGDAKNVKMWYTVKVHRPRQLNLANRNNPVEDVETELNSPTLDFQLKEEEDKDAEKENEGGKKEDSYEYPEEGSSEGHKKVAKVDIKDKSKPKNEESLEEEEEEKKDEIEHKHGVESEEKEHEDEKTEEKEEEPPKESKEKAEEKPENIVEPAEKEEETEEIVETPMLDGNETDSNATDTAFSSFFDEYLNNAGQWPMLKIGLIATIILCALLFLIGCCCYHKDCCCYSDKKKITTKTANGYQYHMTNGGQNGANGQEMKPLTKAVQNGLKESANSTLQRSKSERSDENPLDILEKALISPLEESEAHQSAEIHGELTKLLIPDDSKDAQMFRDTLEAAPQLWPKRLRIDALVGNGIFGVINRGLLIDSEQGMSSEVTVSSVRKLQNLHEKEVKALMILMAEAVKAGNHQNVISLLAVQQQPDRLLVVIDSLFYPDLCSLLRESRIIKYDGRLQKRTASMLTAGRLVSMMNDVIAGTGHLIKNGIFHPMLASCNVLVAGGVLKISGFGFATHRHLHSRQFEPRPTKQRWQAPESFLSDLIPVQPGQSMVWSLGVLLWEIISLGGTPYANIPTPEAFSSLVREQKARLTKPIYTSPEIMAIIEMCCTYDRQNRPDMTDVIAKKMELISITPDIHINLTMEHEDFLYLPILPNLEHIVAKI